MLDKRREFGKWLQRRRLAAGFTQEALAKRLGMTKPSVVTWENGGSGVPLRRIFDLAHVLKVPMDAMLEKLAECEPRKAAEFAALETRFLLYFQARWSSLGRKPQSLHKSNYQTQSNYRANGGAKASGGSGGRFYKGFPNVINGIEGLFDFRNSTKYILSDIGAPSKLNADDYPSEKDPGFFENIPDSEKDPGSFQNILAIVTPVL